IIMYLRRVFFSRLAVDANIGILAHELRTTQPLHIDAEFDVIIRQPVNDHDIRSVLDYRQLRDTIIAECTRGHVNLIETLCEKVGLRLLADFSDIQAVKLRISKPTVFSDCAAVGVEVTMDRNTTL
ncbi:dihydroneopterin aldolase, partial [Pseudomonas sp. S 311-6]|nr:dihydroneopterin aldolase [Pseudomonas sp. S 311-6]